MSIIVYYLTDEHLPAMERFSQSELSRALKFCEEKRKAGVRHVTLSSELENSVGKPGVTAVEDGMTPSGHVYDWKKRR